MKITLCGGGNGVHALIPLISNNIPCSIDVFAPFEDEAERIRRGVEEYGKIEASGDFGIISGIPINVCKEVEGLIDESDIIIIVTPAFAHETILGAVIPHLKPGAIIGAIPSRSGFEFIANKLVKQYKKEDVILFGGQTFPWACRIKEYGKKVEILGKKSYITVAAIPSDKRLKVGEMLEVIFAMKVEVASNMLAITLGNVGQIIHPGIMYGMFRDIDNVIYHKDEIPLFYQGVTDKISSILNLLSDEICEVSDRIMEKYRIDLSGVLHLKDWLLQSYENEIEDKSTLTSALVTNRAYEGLKVPVKKVDINKFVPDFHSRYITEDVPFGLVVSRAISDMIEYKTPHIDKIIHKTSNWISKEYLENGKLVGRDIRETRIPQNYGILNVEELINLVQ